MPHPAYAELCSILAQAAHFESLSHLAMWDQETYMPASGAAGRAAQAAAVAGLVHERRTAPRVGELLAACESDASLTQDPSVAANLREIRRDFDKATKLPHDLVTELARCSSESVGVWKAAREKSDFALFRPALERMLELQRRKAHCLGFAPGGEAYDALLDLYEPGATCAMIQGVFTPLRAELSALLAQVAAAKKKVDTRVLGAKLDPARQHALGLDVLRAMGFDLAAGRLDTTTHPFCQGIGPGDTRLTTRYRDEKFTDALYGTMHEGGHGLYDQGLPGLDASGAIAPAFGTPLAQAVSLGIHESQSRLWENFVGRSREFWVWALPRAKKHFGAAFARATVDRLHAAVNTVSPSLIRVEADEGTYNLHVMLRFELERALIRGDLAPSDLPAAWNRGVKDLLGLKVPDDRRGCLQDIHWSFGLFGYFPTYTLGNLYAAQFWEQARADIPSLRKDIAKGKMLGLRDWLRERIHRHGRRYSAAELCQRITGRPLAAEPLLTHLRANARAIYGV